MPAFGKNGIVNINQSKKETVWTARKPDGTVILSSVTEITEEQRQNLSKAHNAEISIVKSEVQCL